MIGQRPPAANAGSALEGARNALKMKRPVSADPLAGMVRPVASVEPRCCGVAKKIPKWAIAGGSVLVIGLIGLGIYWGLSRRARAAAAADAAAVSHAASAGGIDASIYLNPPMPPLTPEAVQGNGAPSPAHTFAADAAAPAAPSPAQPDDALTPSPEDVNDPNFTLL
jgi:hypothetical protein